MKKTEALEKLIEFTAIKEVLPCCVVYQRLRGENIEEYEEIVQNSSMYYNIKNKKDKNIYRYDDNDLWAINLVDLDKYKIEKETESRLKCFLGDAYFNPKKQKFVQRIIHLVKEYENRYEG